MNKILKTYPSGKTEWLYSAICGICSRDRGYVKLQRLKQSCRACAGQRAGRGNVGRTGANLGKTFSEETRLKMSSAKRGKQPWNKGLKGVSDETSLKMSMARKNKSPINKNQPMSDEQKIKLSCTNRGLDISDFNGFSSPMNKAEREKFYSLKLHIQCFERDNYTCDKCGKYGTSLNAHHLNSFAHFPEGRFDLSNLVTLCKICHKAFHAVSGNGKSTPNTKEQYLAFKDNLPVKKTVYILTGAPAAGKSWVASKLTNFDVIDSDVVAKKQLVKEVSKFNNPLLTLTVGVSTFMKRNPQWDYKLVVIVEEEDTINARMTARGGKITDTIKRRLKRMASLRKLATFSGTSFEVLQHLSSITF